MDFFQGMRYYAYMATPINLTPYLEYISELRSYKEALDVLAEEARQAGDFDSSAACLMQAIRLRSNLLQLDEVISNYQLSAGTTALPDLNKVWS